MYNLLLIIPIFILIMTQIITLLYLGTTFNDKDLKNDWKRKWLIFFAYLNIVVAFFSPIPTYCNVLSIMSSTITLCYLGTSFNMSKSDVIKKDWKRNWLIVIAYINIVLLSIIILSLLGYVSVYGIKNTYELKIYSK
jgi:hypothetical protein